MKNYFLLALAAIGFSTSVMAQEISKNAIGLRIGDNDGLGTEITYQRGLSDINRLEIDLGFRSNSGVDAIKLAGLYQWVWNIDDGFNWYAGLGAGFANYSVDNRFGDDFDEATFVATNPNIARNNTKIEEIDARLKDGLENDLGKVKELIEELGIACPILAST